MGLSSKTTPCLVHLVLEALSQSIGSMTNCDEWNSRIDENSFFSKNNYTINLLGEFRINQFVWRVTCPVNMADCMNEWGDFLKCL